MKYISKQKKKNGMFLSLSLSPFLLHRMFLFALSFSSIALRPPLP